MTGLQRPVRQEMFALALPAVLGTMLQHAVSIIDIFLVGGLGAQAGLKTFDDLSTIGWGSAYIDAVHGSASIFFDVGD